MSWRRSCRSPRCWPIVTYAQDGERNPAAYWLSFALFVAAFLANEGPFVYAPVLVAAYALFAKRCARDEAAAALVLHAAPFAALSAGWLASTRPSPTGSRSSSMATRWGAAMSSDNYGVYLSWIAFPAIPSRSRPTRCGGARRHRRAVRACVRRARADISRASVPLGVFARAAAVCAGQHLDGLPLHVRRRRVLRARSPPSPSTPSSTGFARLIHFATHPGDGRSRSARRGGRRAVRAGRPRRRTSPLRRAHRALGAAR